MHNYYVVSKLSGFISFPSLNFSEKNKCVAVLQSKSKKLGTREFQSPPIFCQKETKKEFVIPLT